MKVLNFKNLPIYFITIRLTSNNCLITIKNSKKTLQTMSTGNAGYKNTKKSSELAHLHLTKILLKYLNIKLINHLIVQFKGPKKFRFIFIKALKKSKKKIIWMSDQTPILHNGCRKLKKRRL